MISIERKITEKLEGLGFRCEERWERFPNRPELDYKYTYCYTKHKWKLGELKNSYVTAWLDFNIVNESFIPCIKFKCHYINKDKQKVYFQQALSYNMLTQSNFNDIIFKRVIDDIYHFQYSAERDNSFWRNGYIVDFT